ncbi:MAG: zinc-binding dehydrogenase, partial [Actinobacteria bacterium]|nr:zinc-binding dehydrogenase [Actinomycetota bacterium]
DGKRKLVPFPAVIGHEAAGVVVEVGPDVTGVVAGDHVIMSIVPNCGTCEYCASGRPNYCSTAGNAMSVGGLFDGTSRLSHNGEKLNHFLTVASFAEGYGAVINTAKVKPGSTVAIFGCGGVGLNIVQGARMAGATTIIAVDVTQEKLDLAKKVGATHVINGATSDPVTLVKQICGGVDYAFEALGRESTIQQAWGTVGVDGTLILVGLMKNGATITLDAGPFVNEQSIKGCYFGSANLRKDVPALVKSYLNGELFLDELISERIGLEGLNSAFDRLRAGEGARNVLVFD